MCVGGGSWLELFVTREFARVRLNRPLSLSDANHATAAELSSTACRSACSLSRRDCCCILGVALLYSSCKLIGVLEMDDFDWDKAKYFAVYVLAFAIGTWTNMKVLATANVETVIVFRSCCPIVVAGFDYIFYRRACPTARSWLSLILVTLGAVGYIVTDKEFQSHGLLKRPLVGTIGLAGTARLPHADPRAQGVHLRGLASLRQARCPPRYALT